MAESIVAFLLAMAAQVRRGQWANLRLPISLFPVLLALVLLGETCWWE